MKNLKTFLVVAVILTLSFGCSTMKDEKTIEAQVAYRNTPYDPSLHNRFYEGEDRRFLGEEFDWSGVGRIQGNSRWATLVSDHFFISAKHYHPVTGDILWFWPNNTFSEYDVAQVVWGKYIEDSDTWVGMLDRKLDAKYKRYPLYYRYITDYAWQGLCWYVGQIPGGQGFVLGERLWYRYNLRTHKFSLPYSTDEAHDVKGVSGDSGGPTMSVVDGHLALIGTHWFANTDGFAAQRSEEINAIIASAPSNNTEQVITVSGEELPKIQIDNESGGTFVQWENTSGEIYSLQESSDLITWDSFLIVTGGLNKIWDIGVFPSLDKKFFRLESLGSKQ